MIHAAIRAAIVAVCIALMVAPAAWTFNSYRSINNVATWLAQREVTVSCLTKKETEEDAIIQVWGAEAYVAAHYDALGRRRPANVAVFKFGHCEALLALIRGDAAGYTVYDLALAGLILTHEAGHLRGHTWWSDEAKTECWAIRHVGYTFARLGVENETARRILVAEAVKIHEGLSDSYRLKGCVLPK